ncbi:MAG: DNA methyltransferase [Planctomycetota bacterium]
MARYQHQVSVTRGDCLRHLHRLESGTARLILADPPYGIGYDSRLGERLTNDERPFIWWLHEAHRLCSSPGAIVTFCRWDVWQLWVDAVEAAGFAVRSQLVWDKISHGMGDTRRTLGPRHELAVFATKGRFSFQSGRPQSLLSIPVPRGPSS